MKFRKKPVVIEAVQYTGNNCFEILKFMDRAKDIWEAELNETDSPIINTLEGNLYVAKDDWIIKGIKGEFYPCKPEIFEMTYEPADFEQSTPKPDGHVHTVPTFTKHFESKDCWCEPELIDDFTANGGKKHFLHREEQ